MIVIKEPRYRDRSVLLARYKLPCGQGVEVMILQGAYKGLYYVSNEDICNSNLETMRTKAGKDIWMRAVPLDKLERIKD